MAGVMGSAATALAQTPKHGGVPNVMQREELHVKSRILHHSLYSYGRMQEVWLDR